MLGKKYFLGRKRSFKKVAEEAPKGTEGVYRKLGEDEQPAPLQPSHEFLSFTKKEKRPRPMSFTYGQDFAHSIAAKFSRNKSKAPKEDKRISSSTLPPPEHCVSSIELHEPEDIIPFSTSRPLSMSVAMDLRVKTDNEELIQRQNKQIPRPDLKIDQNENQNFVDHVVVDGYYDDKRENDGDEKDISDHESDDDGSVEQRNDNQDKLMAGVVSVDEPEDDVPPLPSCPPPPLDGSIDVGTQTEEDELNLSEENKKKHKKRSKKRSSSSSSSASSSSSSSDSSSSHDSKDSKPKKHRKKHKGKSREKDENHSSHYGPFYVEGSTMTLPETVVLKPKSKNAKSGGDISKKKVPKDIKNNKKTSELKGKKPPKGLASNSKSPSDIPVAPPRKRKDRSFSASSTSSGNSEKTPATEHHHNRPDIATHLKSTPDKNISATKQKDSSTSSSDEEKKKHNIKHKTKEPRKSVSDPNKSSSSSSSSDENEDKQLKTPSSSQKESSAGSGCDENKKKHIVHPSKILRKPVPDQKENSSGFSSDESNKNTGSGDKKLRKSSSSSSSDDNKKKRSGYTKQKGRKSSSSSSSDEENQKEKHPSKLSPNLDLAAPIHLEEVDLPLKDIHVPDSGELVPDVGDSKDIPEPNSKTFLQAYSENSDHSCHSLSDDDNDDIVGDKELPDIPKVVIDFEERDKDSTSDEEVPNVQFENNISAELSSKPFEKLNFEPINDKASFDADVEIPEIQEQIVNVVNPQTFAEPPICIVKDIPYNFYDGEQSNAIKPTIEQQFQTLLDLDDKPKKEVDSDSSDSDTDRKSKGSSSSSSDDEQRNRSTKIPSLPDTLPPGDSSLFVTTSSPEQKGEVDNPTFDPPFEFSPLASNIDPIDIGKLHPRKRDHSSSSSSSEDESGKPPKGQTSSSDDDERIKHPSQEQVDDCPRLLEKSQPEIDKPDFVSNNITLNDNTLDIPAIKIDLQRSESSSSSDSQSAKPDFIPKVDVCRTKSSSSSSSSEDESGKPAHGHKHTSSSEDDDSANHPSKENLDGAFQLENSKPDIVKADFTPDNVIVDDYNQNLPDIKIDVQRKRSHSGSSSDSDSGTERQKSAPKQDLTADLIPQTESGEDKTKSSSSSSSSSSSAEEEVESITNEIYDVKPSGKLELNSRTFEKLVRRVPKQKGDSLNTSIASEFSETDEGSFISKPATLDLNEGDLLTENNIEPNQGNVTLDQPNILDYSVAIKPIEQEKDQDPVGNIHTDINRNSGYSSDSEKSDKGSDSRSSDENKDKEKHVKHKLKKKRKKSHSSSASDRSGSSSGSEDKAKRKHSVSSRSSKNSRSGGNTSDSSSSSSKSDNMSRSNGGPKSPNRPRSDVIEAHGEDRDITTEVGLTLHVKAKRPTLVFSSPQKDTKGSPEKRDDTKPTILTPPIRVTSPGSRTPDTHISSIVVQPSVNKREKGESSSSSSSSGEETTVKRASAPVQKSSGKSSSSSSDDGEDNTTRQDKNISLEHPSSVTVTQPVIIDNSPPLKQEVQVEEVIESPVYFVNQQTGNIIENLNGGSDVRDNKPEIPINEIEAQIIVSTGPNSDPAELSTSMDDQHPHNATMDSGAGSIDDDRDKNSDGHSSKSEADNDSGIVGVNDVSVSSPSKLMDVSAASAEVNKILETLDDSITCVEVATVPEEPPEPRHQGHSVVVAIDIGTTYSGYAFSFTRDPNSVFMMRKWEGGDPGVINQKTATCMLLTPDMTFHSFGFTARDTFHDLDSDVAKDWYFFDRFKMNLHTQTDLSEDFMLEASNKKEVSALTIFHFALRFFKDHAIQELTDQSGMVILNSDIRWVVTVPAIWSPSAKQFMRKAAYDAGMVESPEQLIIALEPEVASVYCRKLKFHQVEKDNPPVFKPPWMSFPTNSLNLDPAVETHVVESDKNNQNNSIQILDNVLQGTRYMVVDCGGGTVDITVHELDSQGKLGELYKATGGPYGSIGIDVSFLSLLSKIFGQDFLDHYRLRYPAGWIDLMGMFETKKRSFAPYTKSPSNISLPFSFIHYYKKYHKPLGNVESAIKKFNDKDIQWSPQGMLRLSRDVMGRLFAGTIDKLRQAIGDVMNNPETRGLKYMFLVGGFSESPMLQHEIRKDFGSLVNVVIPQGTSMAILKGAVHYGLDPGVVTVRRSRMTYGVGVLNRYVTDIHSSEKRVEREGTEWCTDIFDPYVVMDQPIGVGDVVLRSYTPATRGQKISQINIYSTESKQPLYITDEGVRKCGSLTLDVSKSEIEHLPNRREIQVRMQFGETEFKVSALDVSTGEIVQSAIDFMDT